MKKSLLVAIGKVTKAHGVRGALKVFPYGETLEGLETGEKLFWIEGGVQLQLTLSGLDAQNRVWIAQFEEICGRDQAERLAGREVFVESDRLPELPEGNITSSS